MKKLLSAALCAVMLTSTVCASTTSYMTDTHCYPGYGADKLLLVGDYDENSAFTTARGGAIIPESDENYSRVIVDPTDESGENHVMQMYMGPVTTEVVDGTTKYILPSDSNPGIQINQGTQKTDDLGGGITLPGRYMTEFDLYAVDKSAGISMQVRDAINTYYIDFQPDTYDAGKWYTYRVFVDEKDFDASTRQQGLNSTVRVYREERGNSATGRWLQLGAAGLKGDYSIAVSNCYCNAAMTFALVTAKNFGRVEADVDLNKYVTLGGYKCLIDAYDAKYYLDNIKIYDRTGSEDIQEGIQFNGIGEWSVTCAAKTETPYINLNWATDETFVPNKFVVSLDMKNDIYTGIPATVGVSSYNKTAGIANIYVDEAKEGKWYSYKLVVNNADHATQTFVEEVWRKGEGETAWTRLEEGVDWNDELRNKYPSSHAKAIRTWILGYLAPEGKETEISKWSFRNLQVTDAVTVAGEATVAGGKYDAVFTSSGLPGGSTAVMAVYDADYKMVDVEAKIVSDNTIWTPSVDYAEGYTIKVFGWDDLSTGVPVKSNPAVIKAPAAE